MTGSEPTRAQMQSQIDDLERQSAVDRRLVDQLQSEGVIDRNKIKGLEEALVTCRRIGAAMGILMSSRKLTDESAFDLLRVASQDTHRKLRDVADDVLRTGTII